MVMILMAVVALLILSLIVEDGCWCLQRLRSSGTRVLTEQHRNRPIITDAPKKATSAVSIDDPTC
jgi:hypothetical protein